METESIKTESFNFELSTKDFLDSFKRFWVWIVLVALLSATAVYLYCTATFVPMYTADIKICVYNSEIDETDPFSKIDDNYEYVKSEQLTTTYMDILSNSRAYLDKVVTNLGIAANGYTPARIRSAITVGLVGESTNFFYIRVKDESATMAALIAEEVATIFFNDIVYAGSPIIVDDVQPPELLVPSSSPALRNAVITFLVAFAAMIIVITFARIMDNRIRTVEDIEKLTSYSVLGVIPYINSDDVKTTKATNKR